MHNLKLTLILLKTTVSKTERQELLPDNKFKKSLLKVKYFYIFIKSF